MRVTLLYRQFVYGGSLELHTLFSIRKFLSPLYQIENNHSWTRLLFYLIWTFWAFRSIQICKMLAVYSVIIIMCVRCHINGSCLRPLGMECAVPLVARPCPTVVGVCHMADPSCDPQEVPLLLLSSTGGVWRGITAATVWTQPGPHAQREDLVPGHRAGV